MLKLVKVSAQHNSLDQNSIIPYLHIVYHKVNKKFCKAAWFSMQVFITLLLICYVFTLYCTENECGMVNTFSFMNQERSHGPSSFHIVE